jgi:hypothetical protein
VTSTSEPAYRSSWYRQPFDFYAEVAADRMVEGLEEALDQTVRHFDGFHREQAGQLPIPGVGGFVAPARHDDWLGAALVGAHL